MMRVLFHVQHLLGLGHLRRAELITHALAEAGAEVTVALGGEPVPDIPFAKAKVVQLPPVSIRGADFKTLYDASGLPVTEEWRDLRRDALLDLYRSVRPDIVLLELFPFGRWRFRFELEPLLALAARDKPRVRCVASVRDILVETKHPERARIGLDIALAHLDAVLVHSDPTLFTFGETYPHAAALGDRIHYTGYVAEPAASSGGPSTGEVVVSAGGGAGAGDLFRAALAAKASSPLNDRVWRIFTGPRYPQESFERLSADADETTIVERFAADFQDRIDRCALSISQGGYNTVMNILRARAKAIVIPYDEADETEQSFRADRLEKNGLITVLKSQDLSPQTLAAAIAKTDRHSAGPGRAIDLDGASKTARILKAFVDQDRG